MNNIDEDEFERMFIIFKRVADKIKTVPDGALQAIYYGVKAKADEDDIFNIAVKCVGKAEVHSTFQERIEFYREKLVEYKEEIVKLKEMKYRNPFPTVDCIIKYRNGVVLIERKNEPFGWALPGGFVNYGESVEDAVRREVKEETNLDLKNLKQFHVYSDPRRDQRQHNISVVFTANGVGELKANDDAKSVAVFISPKCLCFDHNKILQDFYDGLNVV